MKKVLITLSLIMVIGFASTFVYAGTFVPKTQPVGISTEDREIWFKERMEWKREQIKTALKEGLIGEEEAKIWEEHLKYMEKFHKDNGFMPGCNGVGQGFGYGRKMMRGNRWNR